LALASAGRSIAAKMAMMAMTTRSSIKVKPLAPGRQRPLAARALEKGATLDDFIRAGFSHNIHTQYSQRNLFYLNRGVPAH
jgi:hypothetical protein